MKDWLKEETLSEDRLFVPLSNEFLSYQKAAPKNLNGFTVQELVTMRKEELEELTFITKDASKRVAGRTATMHESDPLKSAEVELFKLQRHETYFQQNKAYIFMMKDQREAQDLRHTRRLITLIKMVQATVAHDMLSPLNIITMYLNILQDIPEIRRVVARQQAHNKAK